MKRPLLLCLPLLLLAACGHMTRQAADPAETAPPHESLRAGVERLVQPVLKAHETPGLIVGVATPDGRRQFFSYGRGETNGDPLSADTRFPIGSLTKGFVGALLAVLVDEGRLRWDEPLAELLPGLQTTPQAARLTLQQLATHSAGLPRQPNDLSLLKGLFQFTFKGSNFYSVLDEEGLRRFMLDFKPSADPEPAYSNIGYALIGLAIEARTGRPLGELLTEQVLGPLQLSHTGFDPGRAHRAQGHAGDQPFFMPRGRPVGDWRFPPAMQGSAALYSTAADLLDFAVAHLDGEADTRQGPSPGPLRALLADNLRVRRPQPLDAPGIAWVTDEFDGLPITNQVGMAVGHTAYVGVQRESRMAVVVLQTSFNWNFKIGHRLLLRLARGQIDWGAGR
ncbi:beta-lactamase family protein [Pelomonas sp. V22]|uniref:serine hydrolase domain-containing protein n=1 Tax=Pelomonas sp. V22 TaxID=2822139 RepID=UPI0024A9A6EB|nr:serine hydrolase domain-containing protein [Pelomonas sp. V22]MDI4635494.1 beta-lactamase family protein [Pelomonas sp. V22]